MPETNKEFSWEHNLAFLLSRVALEMMAEMDAQLLLELGIGCRHVGIMIWLEQAGGSRPYPGGANTSELPMETMGAIRLFHSIFWGTSDAQERTPELLQQLNLMEKLGLVGQQFEGQRKVYLTREGRRLHQLASGKIAELEKRFLERPDFKVFSF